MKQKSKKIIIICMLFYLLLGNVTTVEAAPKSKPKLTNLTFDMDYYYNTYPDLQSGIGYDYNALYNHYLAHGLQEGRWGSEEFNCSIYKSNYVDLQVAFGDDYVAYCLHYESNGKEEGRNATGNVTAKSSNSSSMLGNVIGTYSTLYEADIPRAINVALAASRINGVVIQPGGAFSFSQTVLPRTAENGYVEAPVIVGGGFVQDYGGGICQVSSTLYAAMLSANLPATERHPHSALVNYIPENMDATIYGNIKDLKFTNVFSEPIQICASADNGVLTVTISK